MGRGGTESAAVAVPRIKLDGNFRRAIDVDYDFNLSDRSNPKSNTITGERVTEVRLDQLAEEMFGEQANPLTGYALERMLRALNVYEPEHWSIRIGKGYYGDEIESVRLDYSVQQEIEREAVKLLALDPNKQIEAALTLEYGYLLKAVKGKHWKVETVRLDDIVFGQEEHYRSLDNKAVAHYQGVRDLPRALVIPQEHGVGSGYRVIDGYHRSVAAKRDGLDSVSVVVGY